MQPMEMMSFFNTVLNRNGDLAYKPAYLAHRIGQPAIRVFSTTQEGAANVSPSSQNILSFQTIFNERFHGHVVESCELSLFEQDAQRLSGSLIAKDVVGVIDDGQLMLGRKQDNEDSDDTVFPGNAVNYEIVGMQRTGASNTAINVDFVFHISFSGTTTGDVEFFVNSDESLPFLDMLWLAPNGDIAYARPSGDRSSGFITGTITPPNYSGNHKLLVKGACNLFGDRFEPGIRFVAGANGSMTLLRSASLRVAVAKGRII